MASAAQQRTIGLGAVALTALSTVACGNDDTTRNIPPQQVGMTENVAPIYGDGEEALYEVKLPVMLPIIAPTQADRQQLNQRQISPFPRYPWVTVDDVEVQVSWTVSNLEAGEQNVWILLDPWNEFAKYWPGFQVVDAEDGEVAPNFSGIELYRVIPGTQDEEGRSSRIHGVFNFDDMRELAMDFATVTNIIETAAPPPMAMDMGEEDPRVAMVNHTFHVQNRQGETPLTDRYLTEAVPGIVGFDIGLRTMAPIRVAIEFTIEVVDKGEERVLEEDNDEDEPLREPQEFVTLGM